MISEMCVLTIECLQVKRIHVALGILQAKRIHVAKGILQVKGIQLKVYSKLKAFN